MMNKPNKDVSHLVGWICAGAMLVAFAAYLLWSGPGKVWLCDGSDTACGREWLSALSGWAAILAAVPTVYLLSRQIRDANRNHNQALVLQLQPAFALAQRITEHASKANLLGDSILFFVNSEAITPTQIERVLDLFAKLDELMHSNDFDELEAKIGSSQPGTLISIRAEMIKLRAVTSLRGGQRLERAFYQRLHLASCAELSMQYSRNCTDRARVFLQQWFTPIV